MSIFDDLRYVRENRASAPRTLFRNVLVRTGERDVQPQPSGPQSDFRATRIKATAAIPSQVRVLIVDDNATFSEALAALLKTDERIAVVGTVGSGEDALGFLPQLDLALVDLGLPGIDGVELTRRLLVASPHVRVIVLSGSDDEETKRRALAAGAEAVLLKCGNEDQLVDAVVTGVDLPLTRDALGGAAGLG